MNARHVKPRFPRLMLVYSQILVTSLFSELFITKTSLFNTILHSAAHKLNDIFSQHFARSLKHELKSGFLSFIP